LRYLDQCQRNLKFIRSLIKRAQADGELDSRFNCRDLAYGFTGSAPLYCVTFVDAGLPPEPPGGGAHCGFVPGRRGREETAGLKHFTGNYYHRENHETEKF